MGNNKINKEEFIRRFYSNPNNKDYKIIGEYKGMDIPIEIECNHHHKFFKKPRTCIRRNNIKVNCPICRKNNYKNFQNTVAYKYPDKVKYFKNPKEAELYSPRSEKIVNTVCPNCGHEQKKMICTFAKEKYYCVNCGDKILSYPNKFLRWFLKNIPVKQYDYEYKVKNDKLNETYYYDGFFETLDGKKYLIEMDGRQHFLGWKYETVEYIHTRDEHKNNFAIDNGYIIIRIDCSQTYFAWIKNKIKNSILGEIFNLDLLNWEECNLIVYGENETKMICEDYCKGMSIGELMDKYSFTKKKISSCLLKGNKMGWCKYVPINYERREYVFFDSITREKIGSSSSAEKAQKMLQEKGYNLSGVYLLKNAVYGQKYKNKLLNEYHLIMEVKIIKKERR